MNGAVRGAACMCLCLLVLSGSTAPAPTHREAGVLGGADGLQMRLPAALAMDAGGNVLIADHGASAVLVVSPEGKVLNTIRLSFRPTAICALADGRTYVGGRGVLIALDNTGRVANEARSETLRDLPDAAVAGIAVDGKDVFVSFASTPGSTRGRIIRMDRELKTARTIGTGYRGCCGILDIAARDGVLYLAENGTFRVIMFDRDGRELGHFGKRDAAAPDGFGGCCNPVNLCFGPDGALWTSEKTPNVVKRFDQKGRLLSVVSQLGRPASREDLVGGCVSSSIAVSADCKTVYVLDKMTSSVRVLRRAE